MTLSIHALSPRLLAMVRYRRIRGRWPNLRRPASFDEKLLWLNLYWRHPLKTRCADKYAVRRYVQEAGLGAMLPKLLGVFRRCQDIDFDCLPNAFALKCSHASGYNVICKSKLDLDVDATRAKLGKWLRMDFSRVQGELHYAAMPRCIICEEYLGDFSGAAPVDYKVYCFDGAAHCVMVCTGRELDGHGATYLHYDVGWTRKLAYDRTASIDLTHPRPACLEQMVAAAQTLAHPFPFVRVDFYIVGGRPVVGELTFTPGGCIDSDSTELAQQELGALLRLPSKYP